MSGSDDRTSEDEAVERSAWDRRDRRAVWAAIQRRAMQAADPRIQRRAATFLAGICEVRHACDGRPMLYVDGWVVDRDKTDECLEILRAIGVE